MKKVFLIGKFNETFEEINNYLSGYFNVQVCVDNVDLIKGMLKLNGPDIIVVSMLGFRAQQAAVFRELEKSAPGVPVLCIGISDEPESLSEELADMHLHLLESFESNDTILEEIHEILHIDYEVDSNLLFK